MMYSPLPYSNEGDETTVDLVRTHKRDKGGPVIGERLEVTKPRAAKTLKSRSGGHGRLGVREMLITGRRGQVSRQPLEGSTIRNVEKIIDKCGGLGALKQRPIRLQGPRFMRLVIEQTLFS